MSYNFRIFDSEHNHSHYPYYNISAIIYIIYQLKMGNKTLRINGLKYRVYLFSFSTQKWCRVVRSQYE